MGLVKMVNVIIADDNINFATTLMNYINETNENIRVLGIAEDGQKALNFLNSRYHIDVVLLDYKMPIYNGQEVLERIIEKQKYENSCIIITGENEAIKNISDNKMVYKVLYKSLSFMDIIENINELINHKAEVKLERNIKNRITEELIYLGYNISHNGTLYLIETIYYIYNNKNKHLDNLTKSVYPIIASRFNKSVHNIKCSIERENTEMYLTCRVDVLKKYFYYDEDTKPNVKTIINTIINKII